MEEEKKKEEKECVPCTLRGNILEEEEGNAIHSSQDQNPQDPEDY